MRIKKPILVTLLLILLFASVGFVIFKSKDQRYVPKRQNNDQIIVYQDSNKVELYFHNPESSVPVDIRVGFYWGDGPYEIARAEVQPGETVSTLETSVGDMYEHLAPGIYSGRILVYDLETGVLLDRLEPLEFRIYHSVRDEYEILKAPEEQHFEATLDEQEYRPEHLKISIDLKTQKLRSGFYGLVAEPRELDTLVFVRINGEEILFSKAEKIPPRSMLFEMNLEPGIAEILSVGDVISDVHVDSFYSDTKEFYDSIPAEIYEVVQSS